MASLIRKPTTDPDDNDNNKVEIFHTMTEWFKYPDGSVYPGKSWTSKRGTKDVKKKDDVEQFKFESEGEIVR